MASIESPTDSFSGQAQTLCGLGGLCVYLSGYRIHSEFDTDEADKTDETAVGGAGRARAIKPPTFTASNSLSWPADQ
jgi:hypothetical protein